MPRQYLQALQHDESSNDGVGGGNGRDDVPCHGWNTHTHLPECGGNCCTLVFRRAQPNPPPTTSTGDLHLTSKRLFMPMLKMCMRRFAAAVTKSIAAGSSWREELGRQPLKTHTRRTSIQKICSSRCCPRPRHLVPDQLSSVSLLLQLGVERFHAVPEELALAPDAQNLLVLQSSSDRNVLRRSWDTQTTLNSWHSSLGGGLRKAKTHSSSLDGASPEE